MAMDKDILAAAIKAGFDSIKPAGGADTDIAYATVLAEAIIEHIKNYASCVPSGDSVI